MTVKLFGPTSTALPSKGKSKTSDELKGVVCWALADRPNKRTKAIVRIPNNDFVVFINVFFPSGKQHVHFHPGKPQSHRDWTAVPGNKTDFLICLFFLAFQSTCHLLTTLKLCQSTVLATNQTFLVH
jgi:hypothetical protein